MLRLFSFTDYIPSYMYSTYFPYDKLKFLVRKSQSLFLDIFNW